jgi:hypothetical protein
MGNLLGSLIWGSQKWKILCCWEWVITNGIRVIVQPEIGECAQAHEGCQWTLVGTQRMWWSYEGRQRERWIPRGSDCDVPPLQKNGTLSCFFGSHFRKTAPIWNVFNSNSSNWSRIFKRYLIEVIIFEPLILEPLIFEPLIFEPPILKRLQKIFEPLILKRLKMEPL